MLPGSNADEGVNVFAALTSSSRTAETLKGLEATAGRTIGIDEREALTNGLGKIREAYETGWSGSSESEDD